MVRIPGRCSPRAPCTRACTLKHRMLAACRRASHEAGGWLKPRLTIPHSWPWLPCFYAARRLLSVGFVALLCQPGISEPATDSLFSADWRCSFKFRHHRQEGAVWGITGGWTLPISHAQSVEAGRPWCFGGGASGNLPRSERARDPTRQLSARESGGAAEACSESSDSGPLGLAQGPWA